MERCWQRARESTDRTLFVSERDKRRLSTSVADVVSSDFIWCGAVRRRSASARTALTDNPPCATVQCLCPLLSYRVFT